MKKKPQSPPDDWVPSKSEMDSAEEFVKKVGPSARALFNAEEFDGVRQEDEEVQG